MARLVCTGRSNREVADELVLSVKTVGYHLSNVYTKLDIHSRAQLINHPAMAPLTPSRTGMKRWLGPTGESGCCGLSVDDSAHHPVGSPRAGSSLRRWSAWRTKSWSASWHRSR